MNYLISFFLILFLVSCDGIERKKVNTSSASRNSTNDPISSTSRRSSDSTSALDSLYQSVIGPKDSVDVTVKEIHSEFRFVDELNRANGPRIFWSRRSRGKKLRQGECIELEYRLVLPSGEIIDGSNRLERSSIPFIVGFNMQSKGWDMALRQMAVGDIAKIEIPASLAYGRKGLEPIIPPNSSLWLFVQIHGKNRPDVLMEGIRVWKVWEGESKAKSTDKLVFDMIASTPSKSNVINTRKSTPYSFPEDRRELPIGLSKVLKKAKQGEQLFVVLEPEMAYGDKGYKDLIKANEALFCNVMILKTE